MTNKHFEAAVEIIKDYRNMGADKQELTLIASSFVRLFEKFNNKFDKNIFAEACGVKL